MSSDDLDRMQWGWIVILAVAIAFLLATGYVAYDTGALGSFLPRVARGVVFAVGALVALAGFLGIHEATKKAAQSSAAKVLNKKGARFVIVVLCLLLGAGFILAACLKVDSAAWECRIDKVVVAEPVESRCGSRMVYQRMRSYKVHLTRASRLPDIGVGDAVPSLQGRVTDRKTSAVSIDSNKEGFCASPGADTPLNGESRMPLVSDCAAENGVYDVNVNVCDLGSARGASAVALRDAVELAVHQGLNPYPLTCE